MNSINWTKKATKQLRKIPQQSQVSIVDTVSDKLSMFPDCTGVKALVDSSYDYRLRVGNYRVFFEFDGGVKLVSIEEVKIRNERTY